MTKAQLVEILRSFIILIDSGEHVRDWWEKSVWSGVITGLRKESLAIKYLDNWAFQFTEAVHILQHKEWIQAPWNAIRFPYSDAIIWHFQGLRIERSRLVGSRLCYSKSNIKIYLSTLHQ